jgi:hypothetical protein
MDSLIALFVAATEVKSNVPVRLAAIIATALRSGHPVSAISASSLPLGLGHVDGQYC